MTTPSQSNPGPDGGRFKNSPPLLQWQTLSSIIGVILLVALPRLTALNQYLIVDEADRWHWAEDFVLALSRGDLPERWWAMAIPALCRSGLKPSGFWGKRSGALSLPVNGLAMPAST
ncbi:MAG: hypothetical protein HC875_02590 [Anaerolineales bacterium]|nr:hypothetical protein [Anaerolineales bacterium]